ncbi:hypothetical protein [Mucilaginibacter psychrotolerans]|uniref:HEAT repeat domain-containing protein n=1 Tax=Mucilaginibacter psychrotolerans TaxID=1524096 RepID=A0A4Y8S7S9_9SPHI|nr:hypothetical protein [Mucilaginibacter psychrotolerans]TFF34640.1 hypothetical protein E2R66_21285 [Mucilaginibacter psychrotolerans]
MEATIRGYFDDLYANDAVSRYSSFVDIISKTNQPVAWVYEVWDELVTMLSDTNNHRRAIASQVLCNLAKSDIEGRMIHDIRKLMQLTYDEKFVTARHTLQSLWKIAVVKPEYNELLVGHLTDRFTHAMSNHNGTLVRFDIIELFKKIYDATGDQEVKQQAAQLIATEIDLKYRKKYAAVWKAQTGE